MSKKGKGRVAYLRRLKKEVLEALDASGASDAQKKVIWAKSRKDALQRLDDTSALQKIADSIVKKKVKEC